MRTTVHFKEALASQGGGRGGGGGDTDGRSPKRQRPQGHSPNRTQRGGSGGEMLHPPGHYVMQHAGDAKKAELSGGGRCCRDRKKSRKPVAEQMIVRMRDRKSDIGKKTQRNEGRVGGATQGDVRGGGGVTVTVSGDRQTQEEKPKGKVSGGRSAVQKSKPGKWIVLLHNVLPGYPKRIDVYAYLEA